MGFEAGDLRLMNETREVLIETGRGARTFRTTIWIVVDDGEVFIRSVRGETGKWYQRVLANPEVAIHIGDRNIPATAVPAIEPESVVRTSDALRRKYPESRSLDSMVHPSVLGTTMKLDPV